MDKLDHYIEKYGSDKKLSQYTEVYETSFCDIRNDVTSVLEIGIGSLDASVPSSFVGNPRLYPHYKPGGSLRAWRDYFPIAQVYGVDIADDCKFTEDRIKTFIFSSLDQAKVDKNLGGLTFDIIIDDGLHTADGQIRTFRNLFHKVKFNGYYAIEDIGGGGDGTDVFTNNEAELRAVIDQHEYYHRGNILIIKKSYKGKGALSSPPESTLVERSDLTVVTGLWNIGRPGRSFDTYIQLFEKLLEIDNNMYIHIPKEYEHIVWAKRSRKNTFVKTFELADIKLMMAPFWDNIQKIRTDPKWFNQAGWLASSPQASLEYYNPIVMSKMCLLHDATCSNPFNNKNYIWLDAGIANTVNSALLIEHKALDKIIPLLDPFLFLCYPYETTTEIHGFEKHAMDKFARKDVKWVGRGGLFGGTKEAIKEANGVYYSLLMQTLGQGYMGTEESIFSLLTYLEPDKYRRYMLDSNGLVVKFVQDLLDDKAKLEEIQVKRLFTNKPTIFNLDKIKTYVYILTFNFPDQLRAQLESLKSNPEWIERTHKVLIDNSTDTNAAIENQKIAKEYGFVHYQKFDNIGINGGRQFVAEHFNTTDGDYYIFFEDDMMLNNTSVAGQTCRNGFIKYVPNLFDKILKIMIREKFDFMKLTYTEVFMDNNIQVSWYNVPPVVRTANWPDYDQLPIGGLDPNCPRTDFKHIEVWEELSFVTGDIYYCNWPMIVSKAGNKKMFLDTTWEYKYEQTWMSYMFQETKKGNLNPAVLLAAPITHNRMHYYGDGERREN